MIRPRILALMAILTLAPWTATTLGDTNAPVSPEAETFIGQMLRGVGATETKCPDEVIETTRAREMRAVCAEYDGDFESFRSRWRSRLFGHTTLDPTTLPPILPRVEPKTAWEPVGISHDRIYAVGHRAVGVRFTTGDILIVYE